MLLVMGVMMAYVPLSVGMVPDLITGWRLNCTDNPCRDCDIIYQ